jgi:glycosyltransferase involved in cell wall biosynthesis
MKFALISNVLPPSESANAMIIYRLLREMDPSSYCLLSARDYDARTEPSYSARLPGKHYFLPPVFQFQRGTRFGLYAIRRRVNLAMEVALRGLHIARILRREKCDAVVVVTGGGTYLDVPAAYFASRLANARFYLYLLDQYAQMVQYSLGDSFLSRLEAPVIRGASGIITPNEFLCEEIKRRYQVTPAVIHNPCDLSEYRAAKSDDVTANEIRIVYTGGIGDLHHPAFQNLLRAIELTGRTDLNLHLYTAVSRETCEQVGIRGNVLYHPHVHLSEIPQIQQQADILFLPLGFETPSAEIVRTAAPGKIGEYLASGRPVLVHAPADSFVAWYFRQHECGLVVDENDPQQLSEALLRLLADGDLRARLVARAQVQAQKDFDLTRARARFLNVLTQTHANATRRLPRESHPNGA